MVDARVYQASTFAGIQKLLNMNEAAFDPNVKLGGYRAEFLFANRI